MDSSLRLDAVLRARVPLSDGEAATVVIPLAAELDEWHARGLAYGPLTSGDVVIAPNGRPSLAPRPGQGEGVDDDVAHLLRTVLAAMAPSLRAPLPDEDDDPGLRPVIEHLLAAGVLTGQQVVEACFATVTPEPLRLPDAGALARAHLLGGGAVGPGRAAPLPRGSRAGRDARRRHSRAGRSPVADARERAGDGSPVGRGSVRRRARRRSRWRLVVLVAVALVVGGVLVRPAMVAAAGEPAESLAPVAVDPVLDRDAPAAAAAALTRQRAVVLGGGEGPGLDAVDVPGSPARAADEALLAALGEGRLEGLSVDVQAVGSVSVEGSEDVRVAVTSAMSPYRRVGASGTTAVPGTAPRTVVLHLRWTDDGWRVHEVSDPS